MRMVWTASAILVAVCAATTSAQQPDAAPSRPSASLRSEVRDGDRQEVYLSAPQTSLPSAPFGAPPAPSPRQAPPPRQAPSPRPAPPPRQALTLAELEAIAAANNPTLRQAQARIEAARGRWVQGGLRPNPVVGFSGDEIGEEDAAGQYGFFVGQKYITGNKLGLNRKVAEREIGIVVQESIAQRWRVLTDVRLAYYDLLISQRRVAIAGDMQRISTDAVDTIRELVAGEQAARVALLQAEVEAESTVVLVASAHNEREAAWRRLAAVLGTPNRPLAEVEGVVDQALPTIVWNETLERLCSQSPEIAAATANIERARWALQRAEVEAKPDVNVQLGVSYGDFTNDVFSTVQVSIPIPIHNRNQGGIHTARADIVTAEQNAGRIALDLQRRLAEVYRKYANSRQKAERYRKSILPKAQETLELVTLGYKAGEKNYPYLTLLTAQRTLFDAQWSYVDALREIWAANVEIEGMLLTRSLETPSSG